jgi:hypothetical protein
MLAVAVAAEVSAALVVPGVQLPVPAPLPDEPELPDRAAPVPPQVPVLASWQVLVDLARLPVVAHLAVEAAVPAELLSRQSFSAAMAGSSP